MPKVLSAIFSYEDMKKRWNQDNPNPDGPYNRYSRRDELQQGIYALDKWLIRVDDEDKTIATIGWKECPSHTVVGGLLATNRANPKRPEFEQGLGRNERALQSAREPQMNQSKPLVAAFGAREGSPEAWIERGRSRGWVFSQDENFNQVRELLPEQVINEWNSAYPNGNWAIRPITDADSLAKWIFIDDPYPDFDLLKMETGWFSILKKRKFNFQVMKEAVKNVVSDLNGESIEGMRLRQKIADEYKLLISKTGNKADIDSANRRLKDLESIKPFLKLMRNYGYNSRTVGGGPIGQVGLFNPVMDDTIWEK